MEPGLGTTTISLVKLVTAPFHQGFISKALHTVEVQTVLQILAIVGGTTVLVVGNSVGM